MKPPSNAVKRRKITLQDIQEMANLVARRMTEKEAALLVGIEPRTWYQFRARHADSAEFEAALTRTRAEYVRANLREMERAAAGKGGIRHDWRAADRLNQIVKPDVYGLQAQAQAPQAPPLLDNRTIEILLSAAYKSTKPEPEPGRVIVAEEVKALPESTEGPAPRPRKMPPVETPDRV